MEVGPIACFENVVEAGSMPGASAGWGSRICGKLEGSDDGEGERAVAAAVSNRSSEV